MSLPEEADLIFGRYQIRIVEPGQLYGKHRPVPNSTDEPLVEFYHLPERSRQMPWSMGILISRHRLSSLMEVTGSGPLRLLGGQSDHCLSADDLHAVVDTVLKRTQLKMVRSQMGFFRRSYA